MDMTQVCPRCYNAHGWSIVMSEEKSIYYCPKDAQHRFRIGSDGYLELYRPEYG